MLTTILNLNKKVLVVDAPKDTYDISIGTHCIGVKTNEDLPKDSNGYYHIYSNGLFFGKIGTEIKFLCKGSELTEEIAADIVYYETFYHFDGEEVFRHKNYSVKYEDDVNWMLTTDYYDFAIDSFASAIEANGFHWLENPIVKPIGENYYYEEKHSFDEAELLWDGGSYKEDLEKWQKTESKTFKNPLIFEIL